MLEFLPESVKSALSYLNMQKLCEIRLRADKPTTVNYAGEYQYLGVFGITKTAIKGIIVTEEEIFDCIYKAGEYSVYSVEEQMKRGFITAREGVRIGIAGEFVSSNGQPVAIKNVTSLCVRIPHEWIGCGEAIYKACLSERLCNLLIVSAPGQGKTTILRDLCRILGEKTKRNILICDERNELSVGNVGMHCDVLKYASKNMAFEVGLRVLRPDIIVTDELSIEDCSAVRRARNAGVFVIASAHFGRFDLIEKEYIGIFDKYAVLNSFTIGALDGVYDSQGRKIND